MSFDSHDLTGTPLTADLLDHLIEEHETAAAPRFDRLWDYYRNDMVDNELPGRVARVYRLAQEQGLPARLRRTSDPGGSLTLHAPTAREIVIENDIAWRVHSLVDFMFAKPVTITSCAPDPDRAALIESFLRRVIDRNGAVAFYQDLALLGTVHGHVDILLRVNPAAAPPPAGPPEANDAPPSPDPHAVLDAAEHFILETVEAPRAIPVLSPDDFRVLDAYVLHFRQTLNELADTPGFLARARATVLGGAAPLSNRATVECTQVFTDRHELTFKGSPAQRHLVDQQINRLGRIPVVHIQNLPQPFFYEGLSEVEPLIPLQDELNTRLSDRANRVTFQSFKMYLGKGIEKFTERCVGPGQMWATDNPEAEIKEFGGDSANPSEDTHIAQIREAMDKTSAVTPLAAGLLSGRVGNLTSENALRITLMGLLSRTEKKRVTYGAGIAKLCELILHAADVYGTLPNKPHERTVRLDWPSPLPENQGQRLREAKMKIDLGVPQDRVLTELGYGDCLPELTA